MILIDSSAWIEFLRDTGSPACEQVDSLISSGTYTCDPVRMEIMAGARNDRHLGQLRGLLARCANLGCEPIDFETAASLYRTCRSNGMTPRALTTALIAAIALRHGAYVLHHDRDFDAFERYCGLQIH